MLRFLKRLVLRLLLLLLLGGIAYVFTDSFAARWREFVAAQLASRGVHIEFSHFGMHPVDGLVAQGVKVFNDDKHQHVLMSIDRLNLDLDYAKLLQKKFFIEGLELTDANVTLPIDPDRPEQGEVEVKGLNARLYLQNDRLDIRRAEGEVAGVQLSVAGSILMPQRRQRTPEEMKQDEASAEKRMAFLREKRLQMQEGLHWLKRFSFAKKPRLALEVNGLADKIEDLAATLTFNAEGLGYESYECRELSARAEYNAGVIDVSQLRLRDRVGTLEASALWNMSSEAVRFNLHTTADLPQLAKCFLESDALREIVFYESAPPSLTLDGTWYVKGPKAAMARPVEALGSLQCGRFNSRGEVFEGISASFGLAPQGFYVRDGMLRHRTGSLALQAMFQETSGLKYRAVLRMDPHAFLPFAGDKGLREAVQRFEVSDASTIFVRMEGRGPDSSLAHCSNVGHAEFRDVRYRGVEFSSATGDIEIAGRQMTFRKVAMGVRTGTAEAQEVLIDDNDKWVRLTGVKARLDPVPLTSCFARQTAEDIGRYHLPPTTEVTLDGTIGTIGPARNNFQIKFKASEGSGIDPLWGKDYVIQSPSGTLGFKGSKLTFDIKGRVFSGAMTAKGHAELENEAAGYDVDLTAEHFPFKVLGHDLPFEKLKATVKGGKTLTTADIKSTLLNGAFGMKGSVDTAARPMLYRGSVEINALSFRQFARIYAPKEETEGDLTGHMEFTGRMNEPRTMKGSGVLVLLNSNLYAVPVLGPLTPLLGALLPTPIKGYNVAREANCTFRVADGFVATDNFEALTSVFKLLARGTIDFINDSVQLKAQARAKGLPGLVLLPVSELLEYKGDGTVENPAWRPTVFSLGEGRKRDERKPPSAAELDAAARAAAGSTSPAQDPVPKPRANPLLRPGR